MLQSLQSLFIGRQYDWLQEMQQTHRVWQDERTGQWHVFHYEDVKRVLSDYATFSSRREPNTEVNRQFMENSFLVMDPPQHRRYRGLVASVFTPRAISTLVPRRQMKRKAVARLDADEEAQHHEEVSIAVTGGQILSHQARAALEQEADLVATDADAERPDETPRQGAV